MELFFLRELVVILAASVLIFLVSHRLRLPAVVGFLATGILIGPSGLGLVRDTRGIGTVAEIGVIMLLFTVGLEFSLERLRQIRKYFWAGGGIQVALTTLLVLALLPLIHFRAGEGIFYGFLISLSSTAVVLKILADRGEIDSPQGNIAVGILLFQDLAMVLMIAVVPLLSASGGAPVSRIVQKFAVALIAISAVSLLARRLVPWILHVIVQTRVREVFVISALVMCLGMALLTSSFGLSLALGAFLAGIIISESEYSPQIVSDILPFRDLFNSLFFISIGMLLDLNAVWSDKEIIALLVLSIFLLKAVVVFLTVKMLGQSSRIAFMVGLSLAQIGEFSFVLASVGRASGFLSGNIFQAFIASSVLTIFATPFLIQLSPALAEKASRFLGGAETAGPGTAEKNTEELRHHVIIAGYGLNGQNLARVLKEVGISYIILELNPDTVREARSRGEPIVFGDVSSKEILVSAGITRARLIVFAISDPNAVRRAVKVSRLASPDVFIIVRTRYTTEIDELYRLGANEVIPEEFETSIEIFARTLEEFHIPKNIIDAQIKIIRSERYGVLRGTPLTRFSMGRISELLTAGIAETFFVHEGSTADGKTLEELALRQATGAIVIALVRGDRSFTSPPPDFRIEPRDILVLFATHENMDRAFTFLGSEPGRA
jgi:CPA2 family monovalent cation:H+ antiporter-2